MDRIRETLLAVRFSWFVIFHPFKGFWELKREKRGNISSATLILLAMVFVFILRRQFTGFIINPHDINTMNIVIQFSFILLPFLLWCVSNWSITTLMDGEGSLKDIYIATAYALVPIVLLNIPMLIISNIFVLEEMTLYSLIEGVSIFWAVFLVLVGIMTIHQFTMSKTIGAILITLAGMVVILTIVLLFFSLIQQMLYFGRLVYFELFQRK